VAFSPDGFRAISASPGDDTVRLWNVDTGEQLKQFHVTPNAFAKLTWLGFSPDGQRVLLAHGYGYGTLRVFDAQTLEPQGADTGPGRVASLAFFPKSLRALLFRGKETGLRLWDLEAGNEVKAPKGHRRAVSSVTFAPDGHYLVSGSYDGNVALWDLESKAYRGGYSHYLHVHSVAVSPDERYVLSGGEGNPDPSQNKTLFFWEIDPRQLIAIFAAQNVRVTSVAFSSDGRLALVGGLNHSSMKGDLRVWDSAKRAEIEVFHKKDYEGINCVAFLPPDDKHAVCGGVPGIVRLWNLTTGEQLRSLAGHANAVTSVACSPDGRYILSGGADSTVRLWDLQEKEPKGLVLDDAPKATITSVVYAPDGKTMAAAGLDGRITLWDAATRKVLWQTQLPGAVHGLSFARDSRHLATANANGTIYILRLDSASGGR
jgi:WD40 repeat protein